MLQIAIIDNTAAGRNELNSLVSGLLNSPVVSNQQIVPKVNVELFSPNEARHQVAPEICIVGAKFALTKTAELKSLRRSWSTATIIIRLEQIGDNISILESLARIGIDDIITKDTTPTDFLTKLLINSQKQVQRKKSQLVIVDSGKGGLGVTSVVAGLAEKIALTGSKVLVIDFDYESSDLSRFVHARPYINENLSELLQSSGAINQSSVASCITKAAINSEFDCLTPAGDLSLNQNNQKVLKNFVSVLEYLDELYDFIIVDPGNLSGSLQNILYRLCDRLLFIIGNHPASLYPSVCKYKSVWSQLNHHSVPVVLLNQSTEQGLSLSMISQEFELALEDLNCSQEIVVVPFNRDVVFWPGSGFSMFSLGNKQIKEAFCAATELIAPALESEPKQVRPYFDPLFIRNLAAGGKKLFMKKNQNLLPEIAGCPRAMLPVIDQSNDPETSLKEWLGTVPAKS